MADQQDRWTLWVSFDSDDCSIQDIKHTGDCMSHQFGRDEYRAMKEKMNIYLTQMLSYDLIDPHFSVRLAANNAIVALATAVSVLFFAIIDCRKVLEEMGAPEMEPGETLYHLLDDLTGIP